jgi:hypothetical protein
MSELTPVDLFRAPGAELVVEAGERRGVSKLGVASIVVGAVSALTMIAAVTLALLWGVGDDTGNEPSQEPGALAVGLMAIAASGGLVLGIGLGIAGLFQTKHSRIPAIIGLVLSAFVVFVFALLVIIGLMAAE